MKAHLKNYLSITKKEWNGIVVLVILIALVLVAPYVYQLFGKDSTINIKDFDKAIAQLNKGAYSEAFSSENSQSGYKISRPVMFSFNPNNLSVAQWEQLGLSERQSKIIKRYEASGGRFYKKEDVKKMYGLADSDYKKLEPYIVIPKEVYISKKAQPGEIIEINSADSVRLTKVRGVGPGFAKRIYRYKERLGGFYSKTQLKDVYGIDSVKFAEIEPGVSVDPTLVRKININNISFNQLRLFPYLNYKQGNAIIEYRNQHGSYASISDMKNIAILDDVILRKIEPYLSFK